ncbi:MAG TPA: ABC transporter ATP-binding protein [Gaiellaceae bacterium]|nr:ABC transporter ATP-binding protein [Gaiellaceae bacterium]
MSERAAPLLEVAGLEVRYGRVAAVRDLSFAVGRGEAVALVGPNGAGKSTTLHAVMGLVRPARGDVRLGGRSIAGLAPEAVARSGIALVPEGRHVFPHFTVEENLRLGLVARRAHDGVADDLRRVYRLFPAVEEFRGRPAGLLSGGQQQQLAIARGLLAAPDVLLLDEPSLGLAPTVVDAVFETLAEVRAGGVTVVLVEQRAQLAAAFADRTHVLANGELRLTLGPGDAEDTDLLTQAYFGS